MQAAGQGLIGAKIGPYRIVSEIGSGAMGDVYRGLHDELDRPVAIKVLKPHVAADKALVGRFFAEARAVNLIRHENIVECTDLIRDDSGSFMVMELLEGHTLSKLNEDIGRVPWTRAVGIAAQIAEAIAAAHDKGIIHRDLKPDNVFLIRRRESQDYVKILDFGIAHLNPESGGKSATQTGHTLGTPAYMSPEQVRGEKVRAGADIYGLGIILFEMVSGRLPFGGASAAEVMVSHLSEPAPDISSISKIPARLARLIRSMLEKEVTARPASMGEVAERLRKLKGPRLGRSATDSIEVAYEETAPSERSAGMGDTERPPRSELGRHARAHGRNWLPVALAVGALVIGGVATVLVRGGNGDEGDSGRRPVATASNGTRADTTRVELDRIMGTVGLPSTPLDCRAGTIDERRVLLEATALLEGGRLGKVREGDRRAARVLAKAKPTSAEGLALWARASLLAGESSLAEEIAERALRVCAESSLAHAVLGLVRFRGQHYDKAIVSLSRSVEIAPRYLDARFNLGLAQVATLQVEEAVATFDKVADQDRERPNLLLARGEALLLLKKFELAASDLKEAAQVCDDPGRAYLALGFANQGLEQSNQANAAFCRASKLGNRRAANLCPADSP